MELLIRQQLAARHFQCLGPAIPNQRSKVQYPLAGHVIGPALTAANQVLAIADQALVQLAGEQGDAVEASVVAEPIAGHADLAA